MKVKSEFLTFLFIMFLVAQSILAGDPDDLKESKNIVKLNKDKLHNDYKFKKKEYDIKTGKPVDFYIDFHLGLGSTTASISNATNKGAYETASKLGAMLGGAIHLNLFDIVSFTSGLDLQGKSFKFTPPITDSIAINTMGSGEKSLSNTYLNIPININVGGMISEKVGLVFNGGPYIGIRLNNDNYNGLGYKNFDFGLNGTLILNYVIQYPFSIIFGTKFEFGGLNKLGNTNLIDDITTSNYSFFSGARIWF
ncbi:MAG: hypothetical protein N2490_04775 [Ignavibacteria bacterium]|nr:hypothetical protein [Ignavibacteria bacterium]